MDTLTKEQKTSRIAQLACKLIDSISISNKPLILNLGIGIPTAISSYLKNSKVYIHTENGMLGVGPLAKEGEAHPDLINAGRQPVKETLGCSYFDSVESFGLIRGGHIDVTVMGAFEVDSNGNVANWIIPNGEQLGVGGAMDLLCGAKTVIIAMTQKTSTGPKMVKKCSLPLTGVRKINFVVTEYGVFSFKDGCYILTIIAEDCTLEELRNMTEIYFKVSDDLQVLTFQ